PPLFRSLVKAHRSPARRPSSAGTALACVHTLRGLWRSPAGTCPCPAKIGTPPRAPGPRWVFVRCRARGGCRSAGRAPRGGRASRPGGRPGGVGACRIVRTAADRPCPAVFWSWACPLPFPCGVEPGVAVPAVLHPVGEPGGDQPGVVGGLRGERLAEGVDALVAGGGVAVGAVHAHRLHAHPAVGGVASGTRVRG